MSDTGFVKCSDFSEVRKFFQYQTGNSFQFTHVNIRSIRKHWDHFCALTHPFHSSFDVVALTEVNASSDVLLHFSLPGYQLYSYTRLQRMGGGIAVFVKDSWSVSEISVPFTQAEVVALRLSTPWLSLVLLTIYRPPCCNGRIFLAELDFAISSFSREEHVCIIGDMNIDILRPTVSTVADYLDILSKWGLATTIHSPTREEYLAGQLVASCIDHINVRSQNLSVRSAVVEVKLADHYFICCSLTDSSSILHLRTASKRYQYLIISVLMKE